MSSIEKRILNIRRNLLDPYNYTLDNIVTFLLKGYNVGNRTYFISDESRGIIRWRTTIENPIKSKAQFSCKVFYLSSLDSIRTQVYVLYSHHSLEQQKKELIQILQKYFKMELFKQNMLPKKPRNEY